MKAKIEKVTVYKVRNGFTIKAPGEMAYVAKDTEELAKILASIFVLDRLDV